MTEYSPQGQKRKPGRPRKNPLPVELEQNQSAPSTRQKDERQRRRRREDIGELRGARLAVDERGKDENYEYRWINDTDEGRIEEKTKMDDWDIVHKDHLGGHADPVKDSGEGTPISRVVGTSRHSGSPMRAFLCRKPREFYEEDEAKKQAGIDAGENEMRRGALKNPQGIEEGKAYVPEGSNRITHGD